MNAKKKKYFIYPVLLIVIVAAILIYKRISNKVEMNPNADIIKASQLVQTQQRRDLPVSIFIADYDTSEEGLSSVGSLKAKERVSITSELSGKIISIEFEEGQFVKKGDVLVRLDERDLQSQLTRAEFQLELLEARVERQKILLEKEAVSQEAYDQVMTEYNVLTEDINQIKIKIDKSAIKAPFDGVIGFREVSLGAWMQPNTVVATLVDIAHLIVEFALSEKYVTSLQTGMKAYFQVEGIYKRFESIIYAIDPQLDVLTRTIMIRADFDNSAMMLRPGMSTRISFDTRQREQSIYIPNEAIVQSARGHSVWVLKNSKATLIPVGIGTRTEDKIEITRGVAEGDSVVTTGLMQLREGLKVSVENVQNRF